MISYHGYEWLWITLFCLIAVVLLFVFYYGLYPYTSPTRQMMRAMTVLYFEQQCKYTDLGQAYYRMMKETSGIVEKNQEQMVGFYFDNPSLVKKQYMCRSALGLILDSDDEIRRAQNLVRTCGRYRLRSFPAVDCLSLRVPFRNFITYFLIGFFWMRMNSNKVSCNDSPHSQVAGIELYNFRDRKNQNIILNVPLERREAFSFSSFPKPEYKAA